MILECYAQVEQLVSIIITQTLEAFGNKMTLNWYFQDFLSI